MTPLFPYYGGKRKVADLVWSRLGRDLDTYIEPFAGGAAVFLAMPEPFPRVRVLGDKDALIANFWRAVQNHAEEVLAAAQQSRIELDLWAWNKELVKARTGLEARLLEDVTYSDPLLAGRWWWFVSTSMAILGQRERPTLNIPAKGGHGQGVHAPANVRRLPEAVDFLRGCLVRVGDWERTVSKASSMAGRTGIFLDPPYREGMHGVDYSVSDNKFIAVMVRYWAIRHGAADNMRIAFCGLEGEHTFPEDWKKVAWTSSKSAWLKEGADRERVWFSPHCLAGDS